MALTIGRMICGCDFLNTRLTQCFLCMMSVLGSFIHLQAQGCRAPTSVVFLQGMELTIVEGSTTRLNVNAADSDATYIYSWFKDGAAVPFLTGVNLNTTANLGQGDYVVRVADPSNPNTAACYTESPVFRINEVRGTTDCPAAISYFVNGVELVGNTISLCPGETVELKIDDGVSNPNVEYDVRIGLFGAVLLDGRSGDVVTRTINETNAGSYDVRVYVGDNIFFASCPISRELTIEVGNPNPPTVADLTYCQNETPTPLSATGQNIRWYTTPTGGTALPIAPTPSTAATGSPAVTYYATQSRGVCQSDRVPLNVNVNAANVSALSNATGNEICEGDQVTLSASGGVSYLWDNGVVDGIPFEPNATTTYAVTGTDAAGCSGTAAIEVIVHPIPTASLGLSTTICPENIGSLALEVQSRGGSAPYTLAYLDHSNTPQSLTITDPGGQAQILPADSGTFRLVSIQNSEGCTQSLNQTLDVSFVPPLVLDTSVACLLGNTNAELNARITGGQGAYWVSSQSPNLNGAISGENYQAVFQAPSPTAYDFEIRDESSCLNNSISISGSVGCLSCAVSGSLSLSSPTDMICPGEVATLSVVVMGSQETMPNYTLTLTDGTSVYSPTASTGDRFDFEVSTSGTYVIEALSDQSCTGSGTGSVTLRDVPALNWVTDLDGSPEAVCPGTSITLVATANDPSATYQWFKGNDPLTGQTTSAFMRSLDTQADQGTYRLEATGACTTISSTTKSLAVLTRTELLEDLLPVAAELCLDSMIDLEAQFMGENLQYQWQKDGLELLGESDARFIKDPISEMDAGDYQLMVSGACGDTMTRVSSVSILAAPSLTQALADTAHCANALLILEAQFNGVSPSYQWFKDGEALPLETTNELIIDALTALETGTYALQMTSRCGSISTGSSVSLLPEQVILVQPQGALECAGSALNLSVTTNLSTSTYQWYRGDELLPNQTNSTLNIASLSAMDVGFYEVRATDQCGEVVSDRAEVALQTAETATVRLMANKEAVCQDGEVVFVADFMGGGTDPVFTFFDGNSTVLQPTSPNNTYTITNATALDTTIVVRMNSSSTCLIPGNSPVQEDSKTITYLTTTPGIITPDTTICQGDVVSLWAEEQSSTDPLDVTYTWYAGNTPLGTGLLLDSVSDAGTYVLGALIGDCPEKFSLPLRVSTVPIPLVDAHVDLPNVVRGLPNTRVNLSGFGSGTLPAAWVLVDQTTDGIVILDTTDLNTSVDLRRVGEYQVVLWSSNGRCSNTDTLIVRVVPALSVPNVFTPNADGQNDFFEFVNADIYSDLKVEIFNRWGASVYRSTNYQAAPWDGGLAPEGVYYYVVTSADGLLRTGVVHLVR